MRIFLIIGFIIPFQLIAQPSTQEITRWENNPGMSLLSVITGVSRTFMVNQMQMLFLDYCMRSAKMILKGLR